MKKFLFLFLFFLLSCEMNQPNFVQINNQKWPVEIADNHTKRQIGLMWRENLAKNTGMLFIFENEEKHSFWMKNTLIPLDLVWISADFKVVDFKTLEPCPLENKNCPSFLPSEKSKFVLEINAGEFTGKIGDEVVLN